MVQIFWKQTKITVRNSMIILTFNNKKYSYPIWSEDLVFKLNTKRVSVHFDKENMSKIYLFDEDNHGFLTSLKMNYDVQFSAVSKTAKDEIEIKKHGNKKKLLKNSFVEKNRIEQEYLSKKYGVEFADGDKHPGRIIHLNENKKKKNGSYFRKGTLEIIND